MREKTLEERLLKWKLVQLKTQSRARAEQGIYHTNKLQKTSKTITYTQLKFEDLAFQKNYDLDLTENQTDNVRET